MPDEHHPVVSLTVHAVENYAVGLILMGHGLEQACVLCPGGHIIGEHPAIPADGFQLIIVEKAVVGFLLNASDFAHGGTLPL